MSNNRVYARVCPFARWMALCLLFSIQAQAQTSAPTPFQKALAAVPVVHDSSAAVLFNRAEIVLHPNNVPGKQGEATIIRPDVHYDAEVRGEDALRLEYIHTLNTLSDTNAVMIALASPAIVTVPKMQVFTPVDMLWIAADGTVLETASGVVLGNIAQPISSTTPVTALLFLKAGQITTRAIKPHDHFSGSMFQTGVVVQQ